jgi:uncharacterized protein
VEDSDEIIEIKLRAQNGDIEAQVELAARLATGEETEVDRKQAIYWYQRAADSGSSEALYNLAMMYLFGEGVEEDTQRAVDMLSKAAIDGSTDANLVLGEAYEQGNLGFEIDYLKSIEYYLRAACFGTSKGIRCIGELLADHEIDIQMLASLMSNFNR